MAWNPCKVEGVLVLILFAFAFVAFAIAIISLNSTVSYVAEGGGEIGEGEEVSDGSQQTGPRRVGSSLLPLRRLLLRYRYHVSSRCSR